MTTYASFIFVLTGLGVGGSETKIVRIANELARLGIDVHIAYLDPREALLQSVRPGIPTTCLRRQGKYSLGALTRLRALIGRGSSVLVAVNLYPLFYTLPSKWSAPARKIKTVALVNTAQIGRSARRMGRTYAPLLRRCDHLVFGCRSDMHAWVETCSLPPERSEYIYNGVDENYFSLTAGKSDATKLREAHSIPEGAIVIGSVGRLASVKAFDLAILALARLKTQGIDCYLALAGHGSERDRLEQLSREYEIHDRVKFLGLMQDVRPALAMMDVFVLPSASETFSNAALEAMSMGRPIILSNLGGASEMIEHGNSGLLFTPGNLDQLTVSLAMLCTSRELRHQIGTAARKRVLETFRFSTMVERYQTLGVLA